MLATEEGQARLVFGGEWKEVFLTPPAVMSGYSYCNRSAPMKETGLKVKLTHCERVRTKPKAFL